MGTLRVHAALSVAALALLPAVASAERGAPRRAPRERVRAAGRGEVPEALKQDVVSPATHVLSGGDLQSAIFAARDAVLPALVHVEPIIDVYRRGQKAKAAVTGSGVIVSPEGHVLTNNHVVANAQQVTCTLYDKRELSARVVGRDTFTDVAVLQLDLEGSGPPPVAQLGSSAGLSAGQHVIAIGSPLGLSRSLSVGVVSTPDRYLAEDVLPTGEITGSYNTWIQTDAAINPGNSGGPLVDLAGRVVGINARAIPVFGENIGFAIPIDVVKDVASQIVRDGHVTRSSIGARFQELKSLGEHFGAKERGGVLVSGLVPGSAADRAGLRAGDVVIEWDGQPVSIRFEEELPRFNDLVARMPVGTDVPVLVLRRGEEVRLTVRTERRTDTESREVELDAWGLTAKDLTPDLARQRRLRGTEGALVTGVKSAAPAAVAGLRDGDVIREVGGHAVTNTETLLDAYRELTEKSERQVLVRADRGSTTRLAVIEPSRDPSSR